MPLNAVNFVPLTGRINAADIKQFSDLFTGVMTDQPVSFANTLTVGGSQGAGASPFRINGVTAQTANMVEARALAADVQPLFSIGPTGTLAWGPGASTGTDVSLRRSAANQLTLTGLAGTPALVIPVGGLQVTAGNVGIGTAPGSQWGVRVAGTITGSGGNSAMGGRVDPTLTAFANNDSLWGLYVNPNFADAGFTGVTHLGVEIVSGGLKVTAGNVGIGGAPVASSAAVATGSPSSGTIQVGFNSSLTGTPGATSEVSGFYANPATQAIAFTATTVAGFHALNPSKGAGSTITSAYGLLVDGIGAGNTNNYGIFVSAPSGGTGQNRAIAIVSDNTADGSVTWLSGAGGTVFGSIFAQFSGGFSFSSGTNGIGNGATTNLTAPAKNTGGGPASLAVSAFAPVVWNGVSGWIAIWQ